MLRRTPFRKPVYVPPPAPPVTRGRGGKMANCAAAAPAAAKTEPHRNRHLLDMARGMPCLLRVPGVCNGDRSTTVACHSNLRIHGKGAARKADDQYSVWGCSACHRWLDQGRDDALVKELAFMQAHLQQVDAWRGIAKYVTSAKDRAAAQWALDRLNATPIGEAP